MRVIKDMKRIEQPDLALLQAKGIKKPYQDSLVVDSLMSRSQKSLSYEADSHISYQEEINHQLSFAVYPFGIESHYHYPLGFIMRTKVRR
ncbi:hypothetical protein [Streptococcus sp. zg-JUN1979]|uniref:hypothetical protein n=1 Tax=Streptococcus sp. zg-JUN1979 TaxID=3391450 RepID=UPI0039A773FC